MKQLALLSCALLGACNSGGVSTQDVRQAAIDRARQEFNLPADAQLSAVVWTGQEYDGDVSVCGTVSTSGSAMRPQRFMASTDPLRWLVFEDAHKPMVAADPGKFPDWQRFCMKGSS